MKSRRRHAAVDEVLDPSPFDYTLLSHLYVHSDGTDVIDFGGLGTRKETHGRVNSFLRNRSFNSCETLRAAPETVGSYLHLRVDDEEADYSAIEGGGSLRNDDTHTQAPPSRSSAPASNLVRIEDKAEHWWLMCQAAEDTAPYARLFHHTTDLLEYLTLHNMKLPTGELEDTAVRSPAASPRSVDPGLSRSGEGSGASHFPQSFPSKGDGHDIKLGTMPTLPLAKWLDIQVDRSNPQSVSRLGRLLDLLTLSQETRDSCLMLSTLDTIDINSLATGEVSDAMSGYVFLNLMCTPVVGDGTRSGRDHPRRGSSSASLRPHADAKGSLNRLNASKFARKSGLGKKNGRPDGTAAATTARCPHHHPSGVTRSVMAMRFEAVRKGAPRSSVPDPVAVAVIVFPDWVFTIHEKPFAEMDDLLRMVQLHCMPTESMGPHRGQNRFLSPSLRRRFTTPFVMSLLLQIVVGHHLDSTTLARAVDELGNRVFDVKEGQKDQDAVIQRITAVRRCFGECGMDTTRREVLFATLLQPIFAGHFFVADPAIRQELENAQAHLWHFQHEITDCRDTVAVCNWYHNVAIQWVLLRRGNRALRMVLLLTEMCNIMYPIVMLQTIYSMNVWQPFSSDADPPNLSMAPFFVLAVCFLLYSSLSYNVVKSLLVRKRFETRLLA